MSRRKTAIITGATKGLGRALAEALADQRWNLVVVARSSDDVRSTAEALAKKTEVFGVVGDIASPETRSRIAEAAGAAGGVDALFNNAGTLGPSPMPRLVDLEPEAFGQLFGVNVVAQLAVIRALRDHFADAPTIVNISSDAGVEAYAGWGGYGATKAALDHLSRVLATENPGWRVYAVDPGDMRTEMHQRAFPGEDISDRPEAEASVPGLLALLDGEFQSGRYRAREIGGAS